ncbi:hypothetical protein Pmani_011275 [Petrolisthes manimaculis]|uniref:XK-related protein n=1 Tax=Petrolisthes manimaculis TaxID=1843537 RepID=A0AAE1Q0D5_9EUCA|nr:hypothetical protein Pmani_011275 [Petrolisthes manimaculis]
MAVSLGDDPDPDISFQPPPRTDGKSVTVRMPTFTVLDGVFVVTSMLTLIADVATDLNLVARYFLEGSVTWAALTLSMVMVGSVVVAVVSLRWHLADQTYPVTKTHWLSNICLWGILHRYFMILGAGLKARRTKCQDDFDELRRQQSDACMLRVFECFLESAPQLVVQLYIMLSQDEYSVWTGITAVSSLVSLGWGVAAYTKAMRNTRPNKHKMSVAGLVLQTVWRAGTLAARVAAMALAATVFQMWMLLIMSVHFVAMFMWVVSQKTGFSKTRFEEHIFNSIMAVTYCFCFFNLKEGQSRWRMLTFYTVTVAENTFFALTYYFMSHHKLWVKNTAVGLVFGAMVMGLSCMLLYYRSFHPMGPMKIFTNGVMAAETGHVSTESADLPKDTSGSSSLPRREFKYLYPVGYKPSVSVLSATGVSLESSANSTTMPTPEETITSIPTPPNHRHTEMMCSVQDLLANVSCTSAMEEVEAGDALTQDTADVTSCSTELNRPNEDDVGNMSPGSFERSVTREVNLRLSASDMKEGQTEFVVTCATRMTSQNDGQQNEEVIEMSERDTHDINIQTQVELPAQSQEKIEKINVNISDEKNSESNNTKSKWVNTEGHQNLCYGIVREIAPVISSPNSVGVPLQSKYPSQTSLDRASRKSPNRVGIPLQSKYLSQTSLDGACDKTGVQRRSATILRTSVRGRSYNSETDMRLHSLPHITNSNINVTSRSQASQEIDLEAPVKQVPNVELAVIDRMHIIEMESSGVSSEGHSDYENIYDGKEDPRRDLPPKPQNLVIPNLNETQTTQSSVAHDYENICAVNINREMWGVRHWKTYSDIEDRIHDSSTFRERLKLLDSTIASSLYADYNSIMKGIQSRRSISFMDDGESILSRSLPDLSALRLETCLEEPEQEAVETNDCQDVKDDTRLMDMLNQLRANRPMNKSSSVDDIPNYESIWIGDISQPTTEHTLSQVNSSASKSSLVVTIGDVRAKESLCNLYYSTMSDLSFRYYSERMKRNYSIGSLASRQSTRNSSKEMFRAISVPDNKTLLEVSELLEEQRKQDEHQASQTDGNAIGTPNVKAAQPHLGVTPVRSGPQTRQRRKFSVLRDRFEHPHWMPLKSPLRMRQTPQRRNSLQDRTAKALQAGMKVFRRPRVHVITPKKEDDKDTPRLKSPFKSRTVTPTTPAIKKTSLDTPKQPRPRSDIMESEALKSGVPVQLTPKIRTPMDTKLIKGTPKTSTPDDTKHSMQMREKPAINPGNVKKIMEGPKTSTPEGNKQLPQISILSAVSSVVASPDNVQQPRMPLLENIQQPRVPLSENVQHSRMPLSEHVHQNKINTQIHPRVRDPDVLQAVSGKCTANSRSPKITSGNENTVTGLCSAQSASGLIYRSKSHFSLKSAHTSPHENIRCLTNQPMFSGALGLPQYQPETRKTVISVSETTNTPHPQQNIPISHIVLSSPQSPEINMQKSTLSPNSKIFSRRI